MIGRVVFRYKSKLIEAVMEDDGSWRCDDLPCLVRPLDWLHGPNLDGAPLDFDRCARSLQSAAFWLDGEVRFERTERAWPYCRCAGRRRMATGKARM